MPGDTLPCQRWSPGGHPSWRRPEAGGFDASRYGVQPIGETSAREFVMRPGLFALPVLRGPVPGLPARPPLWEAS